MIDDRQPAGVPASGAPRTWRSAHTTWPVEVGYSHGVACGRLLLVGGLRARTHSGGEKVAGLAAQATEAVALLAETLQGLGASLADVVKLVAFYTSSAATEAATLFALAEAIGADSPTTVSVVPVPYQPYPGSVIELQAVAIRGAGGPGCKRTATIEDGPERPAPFVDGVRCENHVFASMQSAASRDGTLTAPGDILRQSEVCMERLGAVLAELGADYDDAVKFNIYYLGAGTAADWEPAARIRAGYFHEPGPAATGIPVPGFDDPDQTITMEIWAMRDGDGARLPRRHSWPEGHWDWPIHLPYKHGLECQGLIFVGGQVSLDGHGIAIDPGDLEQQTRTSMRNIERVLEGLGVGLGAVLSVDAYYTGDGPGADDYRALLIRSEHFSPPGPVSTEILLPVLAYVGMRTEIEVIARAGPGA